MMDRWVGYILDMLEVMGRMEDTAIIFTTDHGFHFGEHGLMGKLVRKWNDDGSDAGYWLPSPLYEDIAHVPLAIYTPQGKPGRSTALTSAVDIMPTILELAEVKVPDRVYGQSLLPALEGDDSCGRDFVVTSPEILKLGQATRAVDDIARKVVHWQMATVTTADQWSLLYTAAGEPAELYNLADDPGQNKNVIDQNRPRAEEMHAKFYNLLEECDVDKEVLKVRKTL
jgi:arylsulfatase A-like enzyme